MKSQRSTGVQTSEPIVLLCDVDGRVEWAMHVICTGCRRVYQCSNVLAPLYAPALCACGLRLMPTGRGGPSTAAPLCPLCYARRVAA